MRRRRGKDNLFQGRRHLLGKNHLVASSCPNLAQANLVINSSSLVGMCCRFALCTTRLIDWSDFRIAGLSAAFTFCRGCYYCSIGRCVEMWTGSVLVRLSSPPKGLRVLSPLCSALSSYSNAAHLSTMGDANQSYQLLIVGGGSGGIGLSSYFARKLGKGRVGVVEPNEVHTFQPLWTLVGGGLQRIENATRPMSACLHRNCSWIKDSVVEFNPDKNMVLTKLGKQIKYEYMIVAMGIQSRLDMVEGAEEALKTPGVCSIYFSDYAPKVYREVQAIQSGNIVFTFPKTPIKCAGAPQKIMYLTDWTLRKNGIRDRFNMNYNCALGVMFSVPLYAKTMYQIAQSRDLHVNFFHNLVSVDPGRRIAVFEVGSGENVTKKEFPYDILHIAPPFSAPEVLRNCKALTCNAGYLNIDPFTLRHVKYPNIYGIGDCTNLPTSKTLAAITTQGKVLRRIILPKLQNKSSDSTITYNGYTSCPLFTSPHSVVMAEFGYDGKIMETFPVDQNMERRSLFYVAAKLMPIIYWTLHVRGYWEGPSVFRRFLRPFSGD
uniref:Sulfide:quinone oxidoreductase, mitochondrial n=1 Tax=Trichuris muris TaxID=70415 RepID=A0A5S6Q9N7_TRIMR